MPALKKIELDPAFNAMEESRKAIGDRRDCSVKVLALLANISYDDAHETLRKLGRKEGCGVTSDVWKASFNAHGYNLCRVQPAEIVKIIHSYPKKGIASITTHHPRRFPKQWANQPNMVFHTYGHVAAFKDGKIIDWSANSSRPVLALYRVVKQIPMENFK